MTTMLDVAVLGGGNGAYATAADLALSGHRVRLWRRSDGELAAVRDAGGITLVAEERQGLARLALVTARLDEAHDGADVVVIALPATTHDDLARELATRLTERHVVLLMPGSFGAFAMARDVASRGGRLPLAFAETGTLPYLARKTSATTVAAPVRAANLPIGVFPASRTSAVLPKLTALYPSARPCADALDVALTNVGPVIHPPLVLLNTGAIDGGRFDIHAAGTTPSIRRVIDALDGERLAARRGWGYAAPHYEMATYYDEARASEGLYGAGAKGKLIASGLWNEVVSLEHRYVTEDVAFGLPLLESAARTVTAATPVASGLLQLFGVLLERSLTGGGRALENLGLGDLAVREIRALLHDGWESSFWPKALK